MTSMTYQVTGMTCEHCVRAVTEEIETLAGVNSVTVALVPGGESAVTVTTDAPLATEAVAAALDEAGAYHLAGVGDEDGAIIANARTLPLA
jgi:copper chaperone